MNSGPRLLRLIKPCQERMVVEIESIDHARRAADQAAAEAAAEQERRMMDHR